MDVFGVVIKGALRVMQIQVPLFDVSFTLWQLFLFMAVAGAVIKVLYGVFE